MIEILYVWKTLASYALKKLSRRATVWIASINPFILGAVIWVPCIIVLIVFGIHASLSNLDGNGIKGPITSRVDSVVTDTTSGEILFTPVNGVRPHSDLNDYYDSNVALIKVGDKVTLAMNKDNDVLTFNDPASGYEWCSYNSDCDY